MKTILKRSVPNHELSKKFAQDFFENYLKNEPNFTVFFEGGLGAGKTYLIRELLRQFGVTGEITSPTYIFVNEYSFSNPKTKSTRGAHFDFYRLKNLDDFFARGFQEIAEDPNISKFVEWSERLPQKIQETFSGKKFIVRIDHGVAVGVRNIALLDPQKI